jgi:uncharacterized protein YndB with AHSA1/START domain
MIRYSAEVGVARPAADVFAAVNDIAGWTAWTDMREVRPEETGPVRVGSAGTFRMPKGPFKGPIRYEAMTVDADRRVVYRMTHPAFEWAAEIAVEPDVAGSRLSTSGTFRLRGWRRLLEPMVRGEIQRGEAAELDRLKAILEAGGGTPESAVVGQPTTIGGGA